MKPWRWILLISSMILLLAALALLLWANLPAKANTESYELHLILPEDWGQDAGGLMSGIPYTLVVKYPAGLKSGQSGICQVEVQGLPESITLGQSEEHIWIKAELITPGMNNQQEGIFTELVQPDKALRFSWTLLSHTPGQVAGSLRIYAVYGTSLVDGTAQLLSVTDVVMNITGLAGLSTRMATSLAVILILLAGFAGAVGWAPPRTRRE